MQTFGTSILSAHDVRRVSVAAPADPVTVYRYLAGRPVRPMSETRIERALRDLGFDHAKAARRAGR